MMRILLPPSEGKTAPPPGPALALDALSFVGLNPIRERVLAALVELCRADPQIALAALRLGPTQRSEVQVNAALWHAPCAPAWQVYSGVLFASMDLGALQGRPRAVADESVVISSAVFGLLRPADPIPAYRLSGAVTLPGFPTPKRLWSGALGDVLGDLAQEHLMVDLRSQTYGQWFRPRGPNWVGVRVKTMRGGRPIPVSHHNKSTKGRLARALVCMDQAPSDAAELVELLCDAGWRASRACDGMVDVLTPQ